MDNITFFVNGEHIDWKNVIESKKKFIEWGKKLQVVF